MEHFLDKESISNQGFVPLMVAEDTTVDRLRARACASISNLYTMSKSFNWRSVEMKDEWYIPVALIQPSSEALTSDTSTIAQIREHESVF